MMSYLFHWMPKIEMHNLQVLGNAALTLVKSATLKNSIEDTSRRVDQVATRVSSLEASSSTVCSRVRVNETAAFWFFVKTGKFIRVSLIKVETGSYLKWLDCMSSRFWKIGKVPLKDLVKIICRR